MKTGRWRAALALVMVLAVTAAIATGLYVAPGSGQTRNEDGDSGDQVIWRPEASLAGGLQRFASLDELKGFLATATPYPSYWRSADRGGDLVFGADGSASAEQAAPGHSLTNIQVEGVDEADIVKTDGQYIYLAIDNRLIIARAYPPHQARALYEGEMDGSIQGLFINGSKLAVLISNSPYAAGAGEVLLPQVFPKISVDRHEAQTSVRVYDVTGPAEPVLERKLSLDGAYVCARMIGDYVYLIAAGSVWAGQDDIGLPRIDGDSGTVSIEADEVWHSQTPDNGYSFTTVMSVNVMDPDREAGHETLLLGGASTVYVSPGNIYVTCPDWSGTQGKTSIHRIHIDQGRIEYHATGEVPGSLLNQFSLDEQGEYLRVATTVWDWASWDQERRYNNLYVLDQALDIFGRLENMARDETIHSARFMGDRCYLVTFEQTDPLFVIDLADPGHPRVLGELVMPGYSDYLHPFDQNHLIGIGMLDSRVKISLYDVTDPASPKEMSTFLAGESSGAGAWSWSYTAVLSDHRAFLFDRERALLVLPVGIDSSRLVNDTGSADSVMAYNASHWQGAYVFKVTLEGGLELAGRISHYNGRTGGPEVTPSDPSSSDSDYQSFYRCAIRRSLYIGEVLYTISDQQIGLNDLATLAQIGEITLAE